LSPDLKSAYVDYLVANAPDYQPRFAWHGDTLFLASPEMQGDGAVTRIQGFRIDTAECDWIPVE